jgi:DGQHR domain-containing protein
MSEAISIYFEDYVFDEIIKAKNGDDNANVFVTIIDGQHRIRGIEKAIERLSSSILKASEGNKIILQNKLNNLLNMELVISCFIDKSLEYQAMIFSTINRTQTKVSRDLVISLFGISDKDTPYKTALEITLALNGHPRSPFYRRIKLYGNSYDKNTVPPLSQATMVKKIVSMISESLRESENDRFKDRKELKQPKGKKFLPFRLYYAENKDVEISNCMFYYFNSVKKYFSELWNYDTQNKPENVLQSTIGFEALMSLLSDILEKEKIDYFDSSVFDPYISRFSDLELSNNLLFPMTTKGRKIFYYSMFVKVFPNDNSVIEKNEVLERIRGEE